ncbi:MAG TPA: hypothetical protein VLR71_11060, partial [Casimicrobiaceae bacterium]|nr:hypothetical protein [Casimicrobiaceae bacterium]
APESNPPSRHRRLPADPAIVAWVVVALFALVPLEHAVASIVARAPQRSHHEQPVAAPPAPAADQAARAAGSATP